MSSPMATRPAIPDLPPGFVAGAGAIDVAALASAGTPPDWLKISPRGSFECRDGRSFTLDPDTIIRRFAADGAHVPIDVGHETVRNNAAPALGWVNKLEARPDGLYGQVEWLEGGKAVLAARTHRYVSPAFHHDDQNRATWLHSVALVAAPALARMPAIASAGHPNQEPPMKSLIAALGLQDAANEAACLAALQAGFVTKAVHDETLAQLSAATTELTSLKKASHDGEVQRVLEAALKEKRIPPAAKDHYARMAANADGLASVKALLAVIPPGTVAGSSTLEGSHRPPTGEDTRDAETLSAEAQKVAKERGIPLSDAMSIITSKKAA